MNDKAFEAFENAVQKADNLWNHGDLVGAYAIYGRIVTQRLSAGRTTEALIAADLVIIERLADLATMFGDFQAADDLLSGMAALNASAGNTYGEDYTTLKRIHLALAGSELNKAFALLRQMQPSTGDIYALQFSTEGLAAWESERPWPGIGRAGRAVLFSRLYFVMGKLLAEFGQYADAIAALRRGLRHADENAPELAREAKTPLTLALAGALLGKGETESAGNVLQKSGAILDETRNPGFFVQWLELAGKLNLLIGEFGNALEQLKRVADICRQRDFTAAGLNADLNLAQTMILLNQLHPALKVLHKARAQASIADHSAAITRADFLYDLAMERAASSESRVYAAPTVTQMWGFWREPSGTEKNVDENIAFETTQSSQYLTYFEDRALEFYWRVGRRDLENAGIRLAEMYNAFDATDSTLIRMRLQIMEGVLCYYKEMYETAEHLLNSARPALIDAALRPELWQANRFLAWCWAKLKRPKPEQHLLAEETRAILDSMTRTLAPADQVIYQLNKWTADEEYIAAQIDQLVQLKTEALRSRGLTRLWRRFRTANKTCALIVHIDRYKDALAKEQLLNESSQRSKNRRFAAWLRLARLPKNRAVFLFLVLPDRVLIIRIQRFFIDFETSDVSRIEVRNLVRKWHETTAEEAGLLEVERVPPAKDTNAEENPGSELPETPAGLSQNLAEKLRLPQFLDRLPPEVTALTFAPDDCLHGFPFAAIVHEQKLLIEKYAISISFETFAKKRKRTITAGKKTALLVGVSAGMDALDPLPNVKNELDHMHAWFSGKGVKSVKLMNEKASREKVLARLRQASYAHFACHGIFKPDQPDASGVVLPSEKDKFEILSLRDIAELNLKRLRHITLTSCWSADHFILPGRWIISLPETFWRSGARNILGSLWPVVDHVAGALMMRFHEYRDEFPKSEALRRDQLDCLHGNLPDLDILETSDPINWAGFNLYGDY